MENHTKNTAKTKQENKSKNDRQKTDKHKDMKLRTYNNTN